MEVRPLEDDEENEEFVPVDDALAERLLELFQSSDFDEDFDDEGRRMTRHRGSGAPLPLRVPTKPTTAKIALTREKSEASFCFLRQLHLHPWLAGLLNALTAC